MNMDATSIFQEALEKYHRATNVRDFSEAATLLQRAAELGHLDAEVVLARMLIDGRLDRVDLKRGEEILVSAANAGSAMAANQLGVCHHLGKFGAVDLARARNYYETSVRLGSVQAIYNLGLVAELAPDEFGRKAAMSYFSEASEKGFALASLEIARSLLSQEGSNRILSPKVREMYEMAISQGSADAAEELAELIESGRIGSYSIGLARYYYREAQKLGKSNLTHKIKRLDDLEERKKARRKSPRAKPSFESTIAYAFLIFLVMLLFFPVVFGPQTCEDGWASTSIGRAGACSWHGGVDDSHLFWRFAFAIGVALLFSRWHQR